MKTRPEGLIPEDLTRRWDGELLLLLLSSDYGDYDDSNDDDDYDNYDSHDDHDTTLIAP